MKFTALKTRRAEKLVDEVERLQKRITERAFQMFRQRGAQLGAALDDWLAAEKQTIWKPAIEICQKDNALIVEAAVAGVEPRDLDIQVTPDTVLIKADTTHAHAGKPGTVHVCEFEPGPLFRLVHLPAPIDPDGVKAEYRNGLLRITAAIAVAKRVKTVEVKAA